MAKDQQNENKQENQDEEKEWGSKRNSGLELEQKTHHEISMA